MLWLPGWPRKSPGDKKASPSYALSASFHYQKDSRGYSVGKNLRSTRSRSCESSSKNFLFQDRQARLKTSWLSRLICEAASGHCSACCVIYPSRNRQCRRFVTTSSGP